LNGNTLIRSERCSNGVSYIRENVDEKTRNASVFRPAEHRKGGRKAADCATLMRNDERIARISFSIVRLVAEQPANGKQPDDVLD